MKQGEVTTDHKWLQLPDEVVARYNAYDCLATARAARAIKDRMKRNGQWEYYVNELWPLLPAVMAMQKRGLPYDSKLKGTYRKRLRKELAQCDDRLRELYRQTADYSTELAEVARITALVNDPPEGADGRKYRARQKKGITLTQAEATKLGRRLPDTWNPNSDQQVARWLFGDLGLKPSTKTQGGKNSVDMDALSRIYRDLRKMDEHARPALHDLMHRARLNKIDQDYLDPEVRYDQHTRETVSSIECNPNAVPSTRSRPTTGPSRDSETGGGDSNEGLHAQSRHGRVYPTIKMTGTESGRFSYADPPVHSWPDEIRGFVKPGEGRLWLGADYSQIEARVFSILTNDQKDLDVYLEFDRTDDPTWDIHSRTAAELFGWTVAELLSKPTEQFKGARTYAKNFRYGVLLYGGGPTSTKAKVGCPCPKCVDRAPPTVDITPAERKLHADRWFNQHQCAIRWRESISQQVRYQHALTGPLGNKWYFFTPWSAAVQREAWNRIIQGTAAGIIHRAMRGLHTLECPMCLQHHDALYSEIPETTLDYWATTMKGVMERPVPELNHHRFPVDVECGPSWGDMTHWDGTSGT